MTNEKKEKEIERRETERKNGSLSFFHLSPFLLPYGMPRGALTI